MVLAIRRAQPADVHDVVDVYLASWRAAYVGYLASDVADQQVEHRRGYDWLGSIVSFASEVLVAVDDDRIVGVVEATDAPGGDRDLPEVAMLYVAPPSWGTPAARALLAAGTGVDR